MGRSRKFCALAVSAAVITVAATGAATSASSASARPQLDKWRGWHFFDGLAVMSPDSAFVVGDVETGEAFSQRWDGTDWRYTSPHVGPPSVLEGVDSLSASDAWAVGSMGQFGPLTEHWDGHRWRVVDSGTQATGVHLRDVSMVTPNNVWAVGVHRMGDSDENPAVMHWDGSTWTRLAAPFAKGTLDSIDAVSADDIWATGLYSHGMWHWDGTGWSNLDLPIQGYLAVSAASRDDAWVVGALGRPEYVAHWDGHAWTAVDTPQIGQYGGLLLGVKALSKRDVWAVGHAYEGERDFGPGEAVIEHWDGHKWTIVPCPHSRATHEYLVAVDASGPDDVWAIGAFGSDPVYPYRGHRFMLHWDGTKWSRYHPRHT